MCLEGCSLTEEERSGASPAAAILHNQSILGLAQVDIGFIISTRDQLQMQRWLH